MIMIKCKSLCIFLCGNDEMGICADGSMDETRNLPLAGQPQ